MYSFPNKKINLTSILHFSVRVYCNRSQTSSVIYYSAWTRAQKCNLFVLYNKNLNVILKDLGGKIENQVHCRDLCVPPLINHGQQPMKMHTEVTLLYNKACAWHNSGTKYVNVRKLYTY